MIRTTLARITAESVVVAALATATVAGIAGAGYVTRDREPWPAPMVQTSATDDGRAMPTPASGLYIPCEYEDSTNCVWDARHMGNGYGRNFIATRSGRVIYLPHRAAHALQEPGVW